MSDAGSQSKDSVALKTDPPSLRAAINLGPQSFLLHFMFSDTENLSSFERGHAFADLRDAKIGAESCKNCPLWKRATQTVFGEGPVPAPLMLVGEQPGDQEDLSGRPFVGPAGKLLDSALERAGLDRTLAYVTNAVKHFKWEPLGNRRLHKKPTAREIAACRPWLLSELALVRPRVVVSLGATATTSLLGKDFRVIANRGQFFESEHARHILVTVHPSAILRSQDVETRKLEFEGFVEDLRKVTKLLRHRAETDSQAMQMSDGAQG